MERFHVGTSGWSYRHWSGVFYPPGVKPSKFLEHYVTRFDCTELNASFYRLPRAETLKGWLKRTPERFRFCPKLSRFITHQKRLVDAEAPLEKFFQLFEILQDRLGPVLIQLPPSLRYDRSRTEIFFQLLNKHRRDYSFALEARHHSWFADEALDSMSQHRIAFVIAHSGGRYPYLEAITTDVVYLRFHGPEALYASDYPAKMLAEYARKIKKWLSEGLEVWAFFNNDVGGYAVRNSTQLREMVQGDG